MLLDLDWVPKSSTVWQHPNGDDWEFADGPRDVAAVRVEFEESVRMQQWMRAAKSHNGGGLEAGCDYSVAKAMVARLRAKGDNKTAGLIRCVACAGVWTKQRLRDANYDVDDTKCPLCDDGPDTDTHRLWQCEAVLEAGLEAVASSEHLRHRAVREATVAPCFWLRGLVPKSWTELPPPKPVQLIGQGCFAGVERSEPLDVTGFDIYLDESGGEYSADVRRRRCGWGLAVLSVDGNDVTLRGGVAGTLSGPDQTSNRAAIDALIFILSFTRGYCQVKPDSKYLVDGFNGGRHRRLDGRNADLWAMVAEALDKRGVGVELIKVTAHVEKNDALELDEGAWRDVIGNMYADGFAGQASTRARPDCAQVDRNISAVDSRAKRVLERIAAVQKFAFDIIEKQGRTQDFPRLAQPDTLLQRLGERSGHAFDCSKEAFKFVKRLPARIGCHRCGCVVSRVGVKGWLQQGACPGPPEMACLPDQPKICSDRSVARIGRRGIHRTHVLTHFRGVWWCAKCGSHSSLGAEECRVRVQNLASTCRGGCTAAGSAAIKRLRKGQTPVPGMVWPLGPDELDGGGNVGYEVVPTTRLRTKTTLTLTDFPRRVVNPLDDSEWSGDREDLSGGDSI
jgi:ribonuclease HI